MESIHGGDIYSFDVMLDFSANINPLGMPKGVLDAGKKGLLNCTHYPDSSCRQLRTALATFFREETKKEETWEEFIICGNGAADLIFNLVLALKPKRALVLAPTFGEYEQALNTVDCFVDRYILKEEQDFSLTDREGKLPDGFLSMLKEEIDIFFLCNPNNPTGQPISKLNVVEILKHCRDHHIFVVVDECFNDFLNVPEDYSVLPNISQFSNLFILRAFTKMYAMAGLRLGYGFCKDPKILEKMYKIRQPWSVSIPAQEAGIAALKESEFVTETRALILKERSYLIRELKELGAIVYGSKANYIFFKWKACGSRLFLLCKARGILIRACGNYLGLGDDFYRIGVRTHTENVQLVENLREICKSLGISSLKGD